MANIVNFTDKQFENRLNDNLEELVQVKKRLNRQPLFYLVGNQGQGKPVCDQQFLKKHKGMLLSLIMIPLNNSTQILTN